MGGAYRQAQNIELDALREYAKKGLPAWDLLKLLKWAAFGSTIRLVSNCEDVTDWDISSSGDFNAVNETSNKRTGSNAIELVDVSANKGTFVTLDEQHRPDNEDWRDFNWLCMWVKDDTALRLGGELTCQIRNNGVWSDEISIPVCQTATVFEYKCIDISAVERAHVDGFRFVNQRGSAASEKVYVDEIIVTDLITSVGDGSAVCSGPVIGPVRAFPAASGQTLKPGMFANFEAGEIHVGAQNDVGVVGVICQNEPFTSRAATDAIPKQVLVACMGAVVIGRNDSSGSAAGDGVMIDSSGLLMDEGSTADEKVMAVALETATATIDSWFQLTRGWKQS